MKALRLFLLIIFPLFLIAGSLSAQTKPDSSNVQKLYLESAQSLKKGDYYTAQNQLEQVINMDSTHQKASLDLMRIYFAQRKFDAAETLAKKLVELHPNDESHWIALGDIYKATENYEGLLTVFDQLIKLKPENSTYYYDKALSLSLNEKPDEALDLYKKIEKKFGLDDRLFIARKDIYMKSGDTKKAIAEAKAFRDFKPKVSSPYLLLANIYLDLKKPDEALKELDDAEKLFPDDAFISLTKADAYQSLGKTDQVFIELKKAFANKSLPVEIKIRSIYNVLQEFDKSISLTIAEELSKMLAENHPQQANAQAVYGDILLQKGDLEKAHASFLKAISLDKKTDFVWEQLLQLEVSMNKVEEAQKHGAEAINLFPTNPTILLFTGYAYLLDKKQQEARSFLEEALNQANPENKNLMVQIYSSLGDTYHALEMPDASNVAYDEALAIDSNNTYVLNNFAYYLALRKEELNKAASMSKKSNEISPNNASFQDTYAWVLFQQKKYADALTWIDSAINLSEKPSSVLIEHKGDILFKLGKKEDALKFWEKALKLPGSETEKLNQKIKEKMYVD